MQKFLFLKYILITFLIFTFLPGINDSLRAQDCSGGSHVLSSQEEVNNFQNNYGPCTYFGGNLTIQGDDITDLTPLSGLTIVSSYLRILNNPLLTNLNGLGGIASAPVVEIKNNPALSTLDGLNLTGYIAELYIDNNDALGSIAALSVTKVYRILVIKNNDMLSNVNGLNRIDNLEVMLTIDNNDALIDLSGLSNFKIVIPDFGFGGNITIRNNDALPNLNSLNKLNFASGIFTIQNNQSLTSLSGLSKLARVSTLRIKDNPLLMSLDGLEVINMIFSNVEIQGNAQLNNIDQLNILENIYGNLKVTGNPTLSDCCVIDELMTNGVIEGSVNIQNNNTGCDSVEEIVTFCEDADNDGFNIIEGDCNDDPASGGAAFFPTATELCDGLDNDCDGLIDIDDPDLMPGSQPFVTCKDFTLQLNAGGMGTILPANIIDYACDDGNIINQDGVSPNILNCNNLGPNTVILTVSDVNGNTTTCSATVNVEDNIPPIAVCKNATVSLNFLSSMASINMGQVHGASNDNCNGSVSPVSVSQTTFDCSDVGNNSVVLTVKDENNNQSTCASTVTVEDNIPPTGGCKNLTVQLDSGGSVTVMAEDALTTPIDNCGGPVTLVNSNASQTYNCSHLGNPQIGLLELEDENGNQGECLFTITVEDNVPPVAVCKNVTVSLNFLSSMATINMGQVHGVSTDNCNGSVSPVSVSQTTFDCSDVGNNSVVLTVKDENNNQSTCASTVTVEDNIPPTGGCENLTVQLDAGGSVTVMAEDALTIPIDNCGGPVTLVNSNASQTYNCSHLGNSQIGLLELEDENGNQGQCLFTITVEDTTIPVAVCANFTTELGEFGTASISTADIDNLSTATCGVPTLSLSQTDFDCSEVGDQTVMLTVTANNGNTATCTAIVKIEDNIKPTLICPNDLVVSTDVNSCSATVVVPTTNATDNCEVTILRYRYKNVDAQGNDIVNEDWSSWRTNPTVNLGIGFWKIQWQAKDAANNQKKCAFIVEVQDNEPPVPVCNDITVTFNGESDISLLANQLWDEASSIDNCNQLFLLGLSENLVSCDQIGNVIPVTLEFEDDSGNPASCVANINVEGLPCNWSADENGIGCTGGSSANYDPSTETFSITSETCYSPAYYRPADSHGYLGSKLCGDGEIIAHVSGIDGAAFAGVTMRESLDPSAKMIQMMVNNTGLARREVRMSTGALAFAHLFQNSGRYWVRLTRSGNQFGAYISLNGIQWGVVLLTNIPMNNCIDIGLITMNETPNSPAIAHFNEVSITESSNQPLTVIENNTMNNIDLGKSAMDFMLFPNPATEEVNLQMDSFIGQSITIEVYNHLGQQLFQKEVEELQHPLERLDLSNHPNGTYFVKIGNQKGTVTKKLILSRP